MPRNSARKLEEADIVFIHDPQPAPLLEYCPEQKGQMDLALPYRRKQAVQACLEIPPQFRRRDTTRASFL